MSDGPIKAQRYDAGELRAPVKTSHGFLQVEGYVARPGIYRYINTAKDEERGYGKAGTPRYELRPRDEVFSSKAMAGYLGAPLTAAHPGKPGNNKKVDIVNAKGVKVGTVLTYRRDGDRVAVMMQIEDPSTVKLVESRKLNKLSPGYDAMIWKTPGLEPEFATPDNPTGRYHTIQRDMEINHLALCEGARGGADLELRLDSVDDVAIEVSGNPPAPAARAAESSHMADPTDKPTMTAEEQIAILQTTVADQKSKIAGLEGQLKEKAHRADSLEQAERTAREKVVELEGKIAAGTDAVETEALTELQGRFDALETELAEVKAKQPELVRKRGELVVQARGVLGAEFRTDSLSDQDVQEAIVKKLRPQDDTKSMTPAALEARCDSLCADRSRNAETIRRPIIPATTETRHDSDGTKPLSWRDQWMEGLPQKPPAT